MTQDTRKKNEKTSHEMNSLFAEWPTPSEVVESFGGDPDLADKKQWKAKKDTPGSR